MPRDQNILTRQRLQLEHLAQAQAKSMHELDELSNETLHFEKEFITGIPLWTYRAGKQPAKLSIPASQRELAFNCIVIVLSNVVAPASKALEVKHASQ